MTDEASIRRIGLAALDLCGFTDKLRLNAEHRAQADRLVHNLLNAVKTAKKIKSPRKNAGKKNEQTKTKVKI